MRWMIAIWLLIAGAATAQTTEVFEGELRLEVTIENADVVPFTQEMVLITIHGQYRRHITLEKLEQPDLSDFNWMQLGEDQWYDTTIDGRPVKNFKRRMAIYPERAGELQIGAFVHHLTLTDEGDNWFEHDLRSEPFTISVNPAPVTEGWWFPVRRLQVSDRWSNAPDQLREGEGVLRIIRIQAIGVGPDMIPPMPELTSPSAMIFPHPEQRLVELSPEGPVSVAFWRWTIRPTNDTSAIIEPIAFDFFDTRDRVARTVNISAQRVAMEESVLGQARAPEPPVRLYPGVIWAVLALAALGGLALLTFGRRYAGLAGVQRFALFDPLRRELWRAARRQDLIALRRAASALMRRDGRDTVRVRLLAVLDRAIFDPAKPEFDSAGFAKSFVSGGPCGAD